jgi:two-component system, chemotaxis family, chemotaxis protein CheY
MTGTEIKRVLIIDDAALVRAYYRQALDQAGYHVDEALNGLEALEKLLSQFYHLLIVDINMPQMDGITFLRTLREKELPLSAVPALVTSTEAGPQDIAVARAAGANYYAVKPLKQQALTELVDMLCGVVA